MFTRSILNFVFQLFAVFWLNVRLCSAVSSNLFFFSTNQNAPAASTANHSASGASTNIDILLLAAQQLVTSDRHSVYVFTPTEWIIGLARGDENELPQWKTLAHAAVTDRWTWGRRRAHAHVAVDCDAVVEVFRNFRAEQQLANVGPMFVDEVFASCAQALDEVANSEQKLTETSNSNRTSDGGSRVAGLVMVFLSNQSSTTAIASFGLLPISSPLPFKLYTRQNRTGFSGFWNRFLLLSGMDTGPTGVMKEFFCESPLGRFLAKSLCHSQHDCHMASKSTVRSERNVKQFQPDFFLIDLLTIAAPLSTVPRFANVISNLWREKEPTDNDGVLPCIDSTSANVVTYAARYLLRYGGNRKNLLLKREHVSSKPVWQVFCLDVLLFLLCCTCVLAVTVVKTCMLLWNVIIVEGNGGAANQKRSQKINNNSHQHINGVHQTGPGSVQ